MTNSMDQYSTPLKTEKTKLGVKYWLNPRRSRPGRELLVIYDQRFPFIEFDLRYAYYVRFLEKDNVAGNHYHKQKAELFIPLQGEFEVFLEDVASKKNEALHMSARENTAVYVKTGVFHKVTSKGAEGVLLVMASNPSQDNDEITY